MKVLASIVVTIAIGVFVLKLATAPLYARYDADQCRRAYARARTHTDSAMVDLHPYKGSPPGVDHRCGETRAVHPNSVTDIPGLRQLNEER
jgi:hypothetical protein